MTHPDRGTTIATYDDAGRVVSTKDARNKTLVYTYDNLDRKTGVYQESIASANRLAGWTYHTAKLPDGITAAKG